MKAVKIWVDTFSAGPVSEFSEFIHKFSELSKWKQVLGKPQIHIFLNLFRIFLNLFRIFLNSANGNKYWASLNFRIFQNLFRIFLSLFRIFLNLFRIFLNSANGNKLKFRIFLNLFRIF